MATSTCHERLTLYAIDALTRRDRRRVENHLSQCSRCRAELLGLAETGVLIERESGAIGRRGGRPATNTATPGFSMEQKGSRSPRRSLWKRLLRLPRWLALAVGVAALTALCS